MSKGIYVGLGSMLFLAFVASVVLFNSWQVSNVEERLIKQQESITELSSIKGDIARLGNENKKISKMLKGLKKSVEDRPAVVMAASGAHGISTLSKKAGEGSCPNNLLIDLEDASPWRPDGVKFDPNRRLVRAVSIGSKGYNPITESGADVSELERHINYPIAYRNPEDPDSWNPGAADCIQVNDDFTEYTIHLREGLMWQPAQSEYLSKHSWMDGEHPLTSDDFIFTFEMIMDPSVEGAAPLRTYYKDVDHLEKIDDQTFKMIWKKKTYQSKSFSLDWSAIPAWIYSRDPSGRPYPKASRGQNFNQHWYRHMLGVGPYRMDSFKEGEYVKLLRNPSFIGQEGAFSEIIFKVVKNPTQRLSQFTSKKLDYVPIQPAEYKTEILGGEKDGRYVRCEGGDCNLDSEQFAYDIYPRMAYRYIGWNLNKPFFKDKRVRRAMTHALNRKKVIKQIFQGLGVRLTGSFYPLGPDYNHDVPAYEYDLEEAKRLLNEAGWIDRDNDGIRDKDGVSFEFTLLVYGYRPAFVSMAKYYKDELAKIGVKMKIDPLDWSLLQTRQSAREFDAYTGGWALGWEADPYQIWHSSQADLPESSNMVGFKNAEADSIIEKARLTFDPEERSKLFKRFHEIVHEEQPYTFLFSDRGVGVWQSDMVNMVFQKYRPHDFSLAWGKAKAQP